MTKPLSPAAQVIWDAFNDVFERVGVFEDYGDALAAVLRAAADQVAPYESHPVESQFWDDESEREWQNNHHVRFQLLDIANELAQGHSTGAPDAL
jgi:hypothetical protein